MSLGDETQVLKSMDMFKDVDMSKLKLLALTSKRLSYASGEFIYHEGDAPDAVHIVLEGAVRVQRQRGDDAVALAEFGPGALLGEIGILCDKRRSASIVALEQSDVMRVDRTTFLELFSSVPALALAIARTLAERIEAASDRIVENP